MMAEHLVYSAAIAVLAGMISFQLTGRDNSWIVLLVSYAPDLDKIMNIFLHRIGIIVMYDGHTIHHGTFHTVAAMIFFGIILAFILHPLGIRFFDTILFTIIGFGAHLFEDALVYPANYMYLWPLSSEKLGLAWLPVGSEEVYNATFLHIANTEVLYIGLVFLILALLVRTWAEGTGWIRWYMPKKVYRKFFSD
jgi:hypothetical protein